MNITLRLFKGKAVAINIYVTSMEQGCVFAPKQHETYYAYILLKWYEAASPAALLP